MVVAVPCVVEVEKTLTERPQELWEGCLSNAGWSQGGLPWGQQEKAPWLIKYIFIQLVPGEENMRGVTSLKPQESRLQQNGKFRKGFPYSLLKNMYLFSVGGLLFKSMPLLSSLTNKLTPGITPAYSQSEIHPEIPHIQEINEKIYIFFLCYH